MSPYGSGQPVEPRGAVREGRRLDEAAAARPTPATTTPPPPDAGDAACEARGPVAARKSHPPRTSPIAEPGEQYRTAAIHRLWTLRDGELMSVRDSTPRRIAERIVDGSYPEPPDPPTDTTLCQSDFCPAKPGLQNRLRDRDIRWSPTPADGVCCSGYPRSPGGVDNGEAASAPRRLGTAQHPSTSYASSWPTKDSSRSPTGTATLARRRYPAPLRPGLTPPASSPDQKIHLLMCHPADVRLASLRACQPPTAAGAGCASATASNRWIRCCSGPESASRRCGRLRHCVTCQPFWHGTIGRDHAGSMRVRLTVLRAFTHPVVLWPHLVPSGVMGLDGSADRPADVIAGLPNWVRDLFPLSP